MDFNVGKDSASGQSDKGRQTLLLLLLLVLLGGFGYLYFFTNLIRTQEQPAPPPPVQQPAVKMPLPARDGATPPPAAAPAATPEPKAAVPAPPPAVKPAPAPVQPAAPKADVKPAAPQAPAPSQAAKPVPAPAPAAKPAAPPAAVKPAAPVQAQAKPVPQPAAKPAVPQPTAPKADAKPAAVADKKPLQAKPAVTPQKAKDKDPAAVVKGKASGPWTLVIGSYIVEEALAVDIAKVKGAGLNPAVTVGPRKAVAMNRLYYAEFDSKQAAQQAVESLRNQASSPFSVQKGNKHQVFAGSFSMGGRAEAERQRLAAAGVKVSIQKTQAMLPTKKLTAGTYTDRKAAESALKKIKAAGVGSPILD